MKLKEKVDFLINKLEEKILELNKKIQSSTSQEQEAIHKDLSELKANLARLQVRKENFEKTADKMTVVFCLLGWV